MTLNQGAPSAAGGGSAVTGTRSMTERGLLRLAGALLLGGVLLDGAVTPFHPSPPGGDANDHLATFPGIAESGAWGAVHFAQFATSGMILAGMLVLYWALSRGPSKPSVLGRLGVAVTIVAAAASAAWHAVDGVALKQAVDAWAGAAPEGKVEAFQIAELARWLEWATASYSSLLLGVALVLLGIEVTRTTVLPSWLGVLIGLTGLVNVAIGVIVGAQGFSAALTTVAVPTVILLPVVAIAVSVIGWRRKTPAAAAS